jgi:hypothetical protein
MIRFLNSYTACVYSIVSINLIDITHLSEYLKFAGQTAIGTLTIIYLILQIKKIRHETKKQRFERNR